MRIGIDARTYFMRSGIARFCRSMCQAMARTAPQDEFVLLASNHKTEADFIDAFTNQRIVISQASFNNSHQENEYIGRELSDAGVEAAWFPSFTLPENVPQRSIVTIHDLTVFLFPQYHDEANVEFYRQVIPRAIQKADAIAAISQATADDIINLYPFARSKTFICYEGVEESFFKPIGPDVKTKVLAPYQLTDQNFFLYVGSIEPRKNISGVIRAYQQTPFQKDFPLVLGGLPRWKSEPVLNEIANYKGPGRIITPGFISEDDLPVWLSSALVFLYPSFYEGFGLPVLEAMAAGTPVITSRTSSLPEVTGAAALLVDPYSAEDIKAALIRIVNDDKIRRRLKQQGPLQARLFSWDKAAAEILAILKKLSLSYFSTSEKHA